MFLRSGASLNCATPVALFHPSVVLEKSDIIGGAFDTGHDAELVVEFNARRPHMVTDACPLDTGGEIIAELILVGCGEFATEECGKHVRYLTACTAVRVMALLIQTAGTELVGERGHRWRIRLA